MDDLFSRYLHYVRDTEPPNFFHRWAMIASLGAFLERQFYFIHGHFRINPNLYVLLLAKSGTKKSTAIKIVRKVIRKAGYETIAADKTTKEKFLIDLDNQHTGETNGHDVLDQVWGEAREDSVTPCFIMADEFNSFFGNDILSFVSDLGVLFDFEGVYKSRLKNSRSLEIPQPVISILGGNTPTVFCKTFPPELLGQGFFSRLLMIHADPVESKKNTFPEPPDEQETASIVEQIQSIKKQCFGPVTIEPTARKLIDRIYKSFVGIGDIRFESYSNRRFEQLIKLCILHTASVGKRSIDESSVIRANTVLSFTEKLMPKALGEFGRSRNADVAHKILEFLESNSNKPQQLTDIWKQVYTDMEKLQDLIELLKGLNSANKIMIVKEKPGGFLPVRRVVAEPPSDTLDMSYLTEEEKGIKI